MEHVDDAGWMHSAHQRIAKDGIRRRDEEQDKTCDEEGRAARV